VELLKRVKQRKIDSLGNMDPLLCQDNELLGSRALMCLQPGHCLRKAAINVAKNIWFERMVLAAIIASSVVLAMEGGFSSCLFLLLTLLQTYAPDHLNALQM
jgi:hypothetical protein